MFDMPVKASCGVLALTILLAHVAAGEAMATDRAGPATAVRRYAHAVIALGAIDTASRSQR